jgi:branched-chain amino acid transport system ATP-binding protein
VIEVSNVRAGYSPDVDILHGISIDVRECEIVTILGPNGCGKSTLLKTVAGSVPPRQGGVKIGGRDVTRVQMHDKVRSHGLGFVPQTDNVFSPLTVWENLALGGQFMADKDRNQRIEELFDFYPVLRRKAQSSASSLSGGERQLLSLARALMPRPRVLLLDEPSAGLSPKVLHEVFDAIMQVRAREKTTVLMVEQNALEALRISDRSYVLSLGEVALTGTSEDLLNSQEMRQLYLGGRK